MSTCIYKKSKYYTSATLNPSDIVEPIGYKFLSGVEQRKVIKVYGQIISKFLIDKSLIRHISKIRTPTLQVSKCLKQSESSRKNYYMSGINMETLSKDTTVEMITQLKNNFFKNSGQQDLINFLQLIISLQTSQSLFTIKDHALSTYFVYYHGENVRFYKYLQEMLQYDFLEYEHEILINSPKLSRPQLKKISNFENVKQIEEYIKQINQIGQQKDAFYNGVHIYISDIIQQSKYSSFAQQQKQFWPFLQFNILVLMSILAQGQHAILRIKGTLTHKTNQYIFLLNLAFSRINFQKNIISNPFTHDKYIICQYFHRQNGKIIAEYLLKRYDLLFKYQDERLLVDPKITFLNDFQKNISTYNDSTPIMKYSKQLTQEFMQNSNFNIYPNKQALLKQIQQLKIKNHAQILQEMQKLIPQASQKKEEGKKQLAEKQAVELDLSLFIPAQSGIKKRDIGYNDISKKEQNDIQKLANEHIKRSTKVISQKKKPKKQKRNKQEDER